MTRDLKRYVKNRIPFGFSLVELTISVFLVAILAGVVGLAMYQSHQHSDQIRLILIQLQQRNKTLITFAEDVRWAKKVLQLDLRIISFSAPDPENISLTLTITYEFNPTEKALYRSVNGETPVLVAGSVYIFEMGADLVEKKAGEQIWSYLDGLMLTIQIGPDANDRLHRYVKCYNQPVCEF